ncbi:IS3 family transposase [Peptoniphilus sp. HCN-40583]|uniref:IS3 family transposase n=1 Tax=Peptoniphilus sp. HCN-40583 TaxID=3134662 RepID=UPI0030BD96A6
MGRGKLTAEEQEILRANPNVKSVNEQYIFYTTEFKKHFIDALTTGKRPKQIFIEAGFDPEILGDKRIERATARWKERHIRDTILASIDQEAANEALKAIDDIDDMRKAKDKLAKQEKIIQQQAAEIEALKKAGWLGGRRCDKKAYVTTDLCKIVEETVQAYGKAINIKALCKNLQLPRSTYYYYKASKENRQRREDADQEALYFIQKAFDHSGKYYNKGSRSLRIILKNDYDIIYNRKKIQRIMRKYHLKCPVKQSRPYGKRKNNGQENKIAPNRVKRAFKPGKARKLFLTDITYIKHQGHFSYVSVIIDSQTNEPVAHKTSTNYNLDFVLETLEQLRACGHSQNAIIHSDQGVHYTAKKFRDTIQSMGLIQSMSRKGNCWDNAPCESFFGKMKQEATFDENANDQEIEAAVTDYINYYRYRRYQEGLGDMTPYEYGSTLLNA